MPRKGRARRFREARELKQGFDDGLFSEGNRTLADLDEEEEGVAPDGWDDDYDEGWDPDDPLNEDPLRADEPGDAGAGGRRAS